MVLNRGLDSSVLQVRLLHSLKVQQKAAAIRIKADLETLSRTSSRLKRSMHA